MISILTLITQSHGSNSVAKSMNSVVRLRLKSSLSMNKRNVWQIPICWWKICTWKIRNWQRPYKGLNSNDHVTIWCYNIKACRECCKITAITTHSITPTSTKFSLIRSRKHSFWNKVLSRRFLRMYSETQSHITHHTHKIHISIIYHPI